MFAFKIKGLICRILSDCTGNACLTCLGSRKQTLVSGQRNMQRCCSLNQCILINLNIRVGIILKTGTALIHHLDGLRNHRPVIVLSHRHIQAGNDVVILLQLLVKRTGNCSAAHFARPQSLIVNHVRIKAHIRGISENRHIAAICQAGIQFYLYIHRGVCLCKSLCSKQLDGTILRNISVRRGGLLASAACFFHDQGIGNVIYHFILSCITHHSNHLHTLGR